LKKARRALRRGQQRTLYIKDRGYFFSAVVSNNRVSRLDNDDRCHSTRLPVSSIGKERFSLLIGTALTTGHLLRTVCPQYPSRQSWQVRHVSIADAGAEEYVNRMPITRPKGAFYVMSNLESLRPYCGA
jgi:hypothetical protein